MMRVEFSQLMRWVLYPLTMILTTVVFMYGLTWDSLSLEMATTLPILGAIVVLLLAEWQLPYKKQWQPRWQDIKNDGTYLLLVQTLLPRFFSWLLLIVLLGRLSEGNRIGLGWWPSQAPLLLQALLVTLLSDLLRYWLHRWNHTLPFLWRFHAVHHSVEKLYWLNTSRFHPFEKLLQFLMDVTPFVLLGVPADVLALHLIWYGVNGFFQHSNIDLRYGWLNYIVSSTDLHRWHHAREASVSNHNYGNNLIVWDLVFGTYYNPKDKSLSDIGLQNPSYPQSFSEQLIAPLEPELDKKPVLSVSLTDNIINFLMKQKVRKLKKGLFNDYKNSTRECQSIQERLLLDIVRRNQDTDFGKKHQFDRIQSYQDYCQHVPISNYEYFRPYITAQAKNPAHKALMNDEIIMFNQTSGSTSEPKLIPLSERILQDLQYSQQISFCRQYELNPAGYKGKILGIVSPAIESISEYGIPIGAASGHFYKNMPSLVRRKYVIPHSVFEIQDYQAKYYLILLLALQHHDITYVGTANPSTLLKIFETLKEHKAQLLRDLEERSVHVAEALNDKIHRNVLRQLRPKPSRIADLKAILYREEGFTFADIWPSISLLTTWTGGSCGVALNAVLRLMPTDTFVMDPGYLASELRGSITMDPETQGGLLTFQSNFFEFVSRQDWERGEAQFVGLHELRKDTEYYLFVTTQGGLYRYNMNDIVLVKGYFNGCPLVSFMQKGNGVCNLTGEKLYELQVLSALDQLKLSLTYAQVLADEESCIYRAYMEWSGEQQYPISELSVRLDALISAQNVEYAEKRKSGRLKCIEVHYLQKGTFDAYKKQSVARGQNESQFKTMLLQYQQKFPFDFEPYLLP
jgi:sterol desaturase/sphingolipid hydroxylase (fatty acid hydroxylase superfamily)